MGKELDKITARYKAVKPLNLIDRACASIVLHMMIMTMDDPTSKYFIALNFA